MKHPPNKTRFRYCEQIAGEVTKLCQRKFGNDIEVPVPIEKIAVDICNLRVDSVDMSSIGKNLSGALLTFEKQILISDSDIFTRNRFNTAHEIAHWALEKFQSEYQGGLTNDVENLADRIAGALLIPEGMLNRRLEKVDVINKETIESLSNIFQVSKYAMLVRVTYLYENTKGFEEKIDWISLSALKSELKEIKKQILQEKQSPISRGANAISGGLHKNRPVVEKLDDYPESVRVVIEVMSKEGIGVSFRSDRKENISVTAQTPVEKLDRPFFIELAGPPNAGKDTQSKILQEYFRNIRGYKVIEIQETYSRCAVEGLELYQKYLWSLLETIQNLLYDRPPRYDVVIINRGIFDLLAMLNFHSSQKHCTAKEKNSIINFLLLPTWRKIIDVVFLMPIDPQHSMAREEEEQRKTVAALAHSFDPLSIPKPPQRIVNESMLSQLGVAYQNAYQRYGKFFNRVHILEENGTLTIEQTARSLIEKIHDNLPQPKDSSLKESSVVKAIQIANEKSEIFQLPLL